MEQTFHLFPGPDTTRRFAALLLHGLTATPNEVRYLADVLHKTGFEVLAPLLPGHGTSIDDLKRTPLSAWRNTALKSCKELLQDYEKVFLVGESLGALLAIDCACKLRDRIAGLVALSPPMKFRSTTNEHGSQLLSRMPDRFLNRLETKPKQARPANFFKYPHEAYQAHSFAAVARLVKLRRELLPQLNSLRMPLLILQDPDDHHLAPQSECLLFDRWGGTNKVVRTFPGGTHELLLGHQCDQVFEVIKQFLIDNDSE